MRLHLLAHVVVLVLYLHGGCAFAVFCVDEVHALLHVCLLLLVEVHVVVADDVRECRALHLAAEADKVVESFVSACVLRLLLHREEAVELHSNEDGVLHLALCRARVNVAALDADCRSRSIEVLILQLADLAAVHGVCILCSEFLDIEFHHAASDLLIRSESYLDVAMLELRMLDDILHGIHDLGDSGLVISSQEGCAVCSDDGLALVVQQFRELARLQAQARNALERNLASVIVLYDLRLHIVARSVRSCVGMGYETHSGHILSAV